MPGTKTQIASVEAWEVLDSRATPTVEVEITLVEGVTGRALVPSGASTGEHEARELRDGDRRFAGRGVLQAVANVNDTLAPAVIGMDAADLWSLDSAMRTIDGTKALGKLGANAVLGVSLAASRAAAHALRMPLYQHIATLADLGAPRMPIPMFNVLNGGAHANNGLQCQEIMIAPAGLESLAEAVRAGAEIYCALRDRLSSKNLSTAVGDEGGFAPHVDGTLDAISHVAEAVSVAGYELGKDVLLALDVAASEFHRSSAAGRGYEFEGALRTAEEMCDIYATWVDAYPIYSIEDGLDENDWDGWEHLTKRFGDKIQLVGDDLFVTNTERLLRGVQEGCANAVLIKPNQIGTLADTIGCVARAYEGGFAAVMSHRSGETEDTTIADLAVGLATGQIKTGAPCRGERTAKYNRLLRIERDLTARNGTPPEYGLRPLEATNA